MRVTRRQFLAGAGVLAGAAVLAPVLEALPEPEAPRVWQLWVRSRRPLVYDAEGAPLNVGMIRHALCAAELEYGEEALEAGWWQMADRRRNAILSGCGDRAGYAIPSRSQGVYLPTLAGYMVRGDDHWPLHHVGLYAWSLSPTVTSIDYLERIVTVDAAPRRLGKDDFAVQIVNLSTRELWRSA